jgi:hypothetical protein
VRRYAFPIACLLVGVVVGTSVLYYSIHSRTSIECRAIAQLRVESNTRQGVLRRFLATAATARRNIATSLLGQAKVAPPEEIGALREQARSNLDAAKLWVALTGRLKRLAPVRC